MAYSHGRAPRIGLTQGNSGGWDVERRPSLKRIVASTGQRQWLFFQRPIEQRRQAVQELARRAATDPVAARAVGSVWEALLKEGNNALLIELARQVGQNGITSAVASLMRSFSLSVLPDDTEGVREAVVDALSAVGAEATSIVAPKLLDSDPTVAAWALAALRRTGLDKASAALVEWFGKANPDTQQELAKRLATVSQQSWEDVVILLDGLVHCPSSEQTLAQKVLEALDRNRLERECVHLWMTSRSVAARTVLIRFFDYDQAALK